MVSACWGIWEPLFIVPASTEMITYDAHAAQQVKNPSMHSDRSVTASYNCPESIATVSLFIRWYAPQDWKHMCPSALSDDAITWYRTVYIDPTCWRKKNTTWKTLAQSHIFLFPLIMFPFILYFSLFNIPQDGPLNVSAFWSFCLLVSDSNMYPLSSSLSHYKVSWVLDLLHAEQSVLDHNLKDIFLLYCSLISTYIYSFTWSLEWWMNIVTARRNLVELTNSFVRNLM